MKTFKKLIVTILVAVVVFGVNIPPVMASNRPVITSNLAIEKLKMEDSGPDLTKGRLILETLGTEPDGTPYIERVYEHINITHFLLNSSNERTYTATKSYGATGTVEVTATFKFNTLAKEVYVKSSSGRLINGAGYSQFVDLGTSTSGEGTKKATAKYSCKINRNLGGWATYSVSVSCNYKGK